MASLHDISLTVAYGSNGLYGCAKEINGASNTVSAASNALFTASNQAATALYNALSTCNMLASTAWYTSNTSTYASNALVGSGQGTSTTPFYLMTRFTTASQSVANNTMVTVLLDSVDSTMTTGTSSISYSAGIFTNTSGHTVTVLVSYMTQWPQNGTGIRNAFLYSSQNTSQFLFAAGAASPNDLPRNNGTGTLVMQPNDWFSLKVWQNSGTTLSMTGMVQVSPR